MGVAANAKRTQVERNELLDFVRAYAHLPQHEFAEMVYASFDMFDAHQIEMAEAVWTTYLVIVRCFTVSDAAHAALEYPEHVLVRPGTLVRVTFPTGGIRAADTFVVVPAPPDGTPGLVWVRPHGDDTARRPWWVRAQDPTVRPLVYHPTSLTRI